MAALQGYTAQKHTGDCAVSRIFAPHQVESNFCTLFVGVGKVDFYTPRGVKIRLTLYVQNTHKKTMNQEGAPL